MKRLTHIIVYTLWILLSFNSAVGQEKKSKSKKPLIVFVCGDHEYSGEETLSQLAKELEKNYGFKTKVIKSFPDQNAERNIPGLEALADADLAVFYLRWRQLPADQIVHIDAYMKSGKPIMGFRTTTHAFNYSASDPLVSYNAFPEKAFGAPPGWDGPAKHTHYGHQSSTDASIIASKANHPILKGVQPSFHVRSWLYRVLPEYPAKGTDWLMMGKSVDPDKTATEQPIAWTWENSYKARVFFTTMGHPEDFSVEPFQRMVVNAIHWELGLKVPSKWNGKLDINVPYRGIVNSK